MKKVSSYFMVSTTMKTIKSMCLLAFLTSTLISFGHQKTYAQPKIKAYGNWCGQFHPSKSNAIGGYTPNPISDLDCACRDHDIDYVNSKYKGNLSASDRNLVNRCLSILKAGGMNHYGYRGNNYGHVIVENYRGWNVVKPFNIGWKPLTSYEKERLEFIVASIYGSNFLMTFYENSFLRPGRVAQSFMKNTGKTAKNIAHKPLKTPEYIVKGGKAIGKDVEREVRGVRDNIKSTAKITEKIVKRPVKKIGNEAKRAEKKIKRVFRKLKF